MYKKCRLFCGTFVQTYKIKNRYRKAIDKIKNMVYNNKCKVKKRYNIKRIEFHSSKLL